MSESVIVHFANDFPLLILEVHAVCLEKPRKWAATPKTAWRPGFNQLLILIRRLDSVKDTKSNRIPER